MVGHFPNTVFLYSNWKYNNFKQLLRKEILEINVYRFVWKRGAVMEMKTVVVFFFARLQWYLKHKENQNRRVAEE